MISVVFCSFSGIFFLFDGFESLSFHLYFHVRTAYAYWVTCFLFVVQKRRSILVTKPKTMRRSITFISIYMLVLTSKTTLFPFLKTILITKIFPILIEIFSSFLKEVSLIPSDYFPLFKFSLSLFVSFFKYFFLFFRIFDFEWNVPFNSNFNEKVQSSNSLKCPYAQCTPKWMTVKLKQSDLILHKL